MKKVTLQIRNLALFFVALPRVIFLNRRHKIESPRKILIVQLAKLGDMVCTTPMFRAAKLAYPDARLLVVGNAINGKVLAGNPDVDEYIIANEKDIFETIWRLRRETIDFACTTNTSFVSLLLLIFSKAILF